MRITKEYIEKVVDHGLKINQITKEDIESLVGHEFIKSHYEVTLGLREFLVDNANALCNKADRSKETSPKMARICHKMVKHRRALIHYMLILRGRVGMYRQDRTKYRIYCSSRREILKTINRLKFYIKLNPATLTKNGLKSKDY